jgi:hypothetical protein
MVVVIEQQLLLFILSIHIGGFMTSHKDSVMAGIFEITVLTF